MTSLKVSDEVLGKEYNKAISFAAFVNMDVKVLQSIIAELQQYRKSITTNNEILAERQRQLKVKKYNHQHDMQWKYGELAKAAAIYAMPPESRTYFKDDNVPIDWPFYIEDYKPYADDRRRELVKAAALIMAEIDRLDSVKTELDELTA